MNGTIISFLQFRNKMTFKKDDDEVKKYINGQTLEGYKEKGYGVIFVASPIYLWGYNLTTSFIFIPSDIPWDFGISINDRSKESKAYWIISSFSSLEYVHVE